MKLPYREKIRQICNNTLSFYRYKRDQREVLDSSMMKSPEYMLKYKQDMENMNVILRVQYLGENSLTEKEQEIYERLKEIRRLNNHNQLD
jgi:hypothetical protein